LQNRENIMLYHPYLVFYLWFLPLSTWVLLPLALGAMGLSIKLVNQLLFVNTVTDDNTTARSNRRRHSRFIPAPVVVSVSNGRQSYPATLHNISRLGLCLQQMPEKLFQKTNRLTVLLKQHGRQAHTVQVRPVWAATDDAGQRIGVKIETTTRSWLNFVQDSSKNNRSHVS
jgi:hypothetical protein